MRFLKADAFFNGFDFLEKGRIMVINDKQQFEALLWENEIEDNRVEKFEGLLCPGFINVHCHLELSHLKNKIPQKTGLVEFGKHIIQYRETFSTEEIIEHMEEADLQMTNRGIVAVGDISNQQVSFGVKSKSKIYYHTFVELIGLAPAMANQVYHQGKELMKSLSEYELKGSLCPHAPYSVSPDLMLKIKEDTQALNVPTSIHNQESKEEILFLEGKPSAILKLYEFLNLDISWYKAPARSGVEYLADLLPREKSILVHNTFSSESDIQAGVSFKNFWCFCPNANRYIEDHLPHFSLFKPHEERLCLGTDSLASNQELDLLLEANLMLASTETYSTESVLRMLTSQGARALGIDNQFGSFIQGQNSGLNLIQIQNKQIQFIRKVI